MNIDERLLGILQMLASGVVGGVTGAYIQNHVKDTFDKKKEKRQELRRLSKVMSDIVADGEIEEFRHKPSGKIRQRAYRCANTLESFGYDKMAHRLREFVLSWEIYKPKESVTFTRGRKTNMRLSKDEGLELMKGIVQLVKDDAKTLQKA